MVVAGGGGDVRPYTQMTEVVAQPEAAEVAAEAEGETWVVASSVSEIRQSIARQARHPQPSRCELSSQKMAASTRSTND